MKVFHGYPSEPASLLRPKVTLGVFDGVHLGHQRVLRRLVAWARGTDSDAAVVTFDRRPRDALLGKPSEPVTSVPHRLLLFERMGIDAALVLTFDKALASSEPETFVQEVLVERLGAAGVLLGHDARFGRNGRGDMALLSRLAGVYGFEARSVPVVEVDGEPVSSTRVRKAIQEGDLRRAERLLGRRVSVLGTVVRGTSRGKEIGYPTANLDLDCEVMLPQGVYATQTRVAETWHDSVTNIGRVPTLRRGGPSHASETVVLETHLPGFSGDLYGEQLEIRFVHFIRPEEVFDSAAALAERIAGDIRQAQSRPAATEAPREATT